MTRLRYHDNHWARLNQTGKAIESYLEEYKTPYSSTKAAFFKALLGTQIDGQLLLDYGGGIGFMSIVAATRGASVVLVEAEKSALEAAKEYALSQSVADRIQFILSDTFPKELNKLAFDIIVAKDIIEYIPDDKAFLSNLSACHKRGGQLLLSTQNKLSLNWVAGTFYYKLLLGYRIWFGWDPTHLRFYSSRSIRALLRRAGYTSKRFVGCYLVPYNKLKLYSLHNLDFLLGTVSPFKYLGWNFIVEAYKV